MIGKGEYRVVHIDLLGSVAGALSTAGIAPATLQLVRDALAEDDAVTAMQDQIKNLQRVAIKASFYFYLPHSDDAYDEVLEALDAAGYKRPDEAGYLGGGE